MSRKIRLHPSYTSWRTREIRSMLKSSSDFKTLPSLVASSVGFIYFVWFLKIVAIVIDLFDFFYGYFSNTCEIWGITNKAG
jgi:hypothetical protein